MADLPLKPGVFPTQSNHALGSMSRMEHLLHELMSEHNVQTALLRAEIEHLKSSAVSPVAVSVTAATTAITVATTAATTAAATAAEAAATAAATAAEVTVAATAVAKAVVQQLTSGERTCKEDLENVDLSTGLCETDMFDEKKMSERVAISCRPVLDRLNVPLWSQQYVGSAIDWFAGLEEPRRSGWLALMVESDRFTAFVLTVVIMNAGFIVYTADEDMNHALQDLTISGSGYDNTSEVQWVDWVNWCFSIFYIIELILRLIVHRLYFFVNDDCKWNTMDAILCVFAAVEVVFFMVMLAGAEAQATSNVSFIRLLRIMKVVKVFRVFRAVEYIAELQLMIDCVLNSALQLLWCTILIGFMLFIFSLLFVQSLSEYMMAKDLPPATLHKVASSYGSVRSAMVSCYQATSGGVDWSEQYELFLEVGSVIAAIYLFMIAFFMIAVTNIVTSTFVEKVFKLALPNLNTLIAQKHKDDSKFAKEMLTVMTASIGSDLLNGDGSHLQDGMIHLSDLKRNLNSAKLNEFFQVRGLDMKDKSSFVSMLTSMSDADDYVDLKTFINCAVRLQGQATSIDLQTSHYDIKRQMVKMGHRMDHICTTMDDCKLLTATVLREEVSKERVPFEVSPLMPAAPCPDTFQICV